MADELIITVSGLRGIVGENLTPDVAADYARAFATLLGEKVSGDKKPLVCLGRDSRASGQALSKAAAAGLSQSGVNVFELGIVTTPGVGIMTRHLQCDGGVIITASHNPIEYNGIKLLSAEGRAMTAETAERIKQIYLEKRFSPAGPLGPGTIESNDRTDEVHIGRVLGIVDAQFIKSKNFKVVLDSVNGAGGRVGGKLLAALGCRAVAINAEATGDFAHVPEPTAANLTGLCDEVASAGADIGFAQDPDADRLAIVDEKGAYIGEEYSLALSARYIFSIKSGAAATNLSTSRMLDDIAAAAQGRGRVLRTAVGEANVVEAMIKNDCIIGGEGNGGVIDLRVGPVRDSLVGIALVLQLMAETGKTVSALVDEIPRYYMKKEKFAAGKDQVPRILTSAEKLFADAKIDMTDGCRFDFADGWVHLRASNTEPVMRVIAETKSRQSTEEYINAILNIRGRMDD
jgi:phosphomannomutase